MISLKERINRSKAKGGRPFVAFSGDMVVGEFVSIQQAAEFFGVNRSKVWEVLNGLRNKTRGVVFKYKETSE